MHFEEKNYVYKIYLRLCPTELPYSKEITISFEQKPVTVAIIWKDNLFQFYIIWCFKGNLCLGITLTICSILNRIILIWLFRWFTNYKFLTRLTQRCHQWSRNCFPLRRTWVHPGVQWGLCYSIFSFMCIFCRSLFVLLYFFFWLLRSLVLFDIRILITPVVSSNSSQILLSICFLVSCT